MHELVHSPKWWELTQAEAQSGVWSGSPQLVGSSTQTLQPAPSSRKLSQDHSSTPTGSVAIPGSGWTLQRLHQYSMFEPQMTFMKIYYYPLCGVLSKMKGNEHLKRICMVFQRGERVCYLSLLNQPKTVWQVLLWRIFQILVFSSSKTYEHGKKADYLICPVIKAMKGEGRKDEGTASRVIESNF